MNFTECDVIAILAESREVCERIRKLGMLRTTFATHRLMKLMHLRAVEELVTWRRSNGFDQCDERNEHWVHSPLPPMPEQTTAKKWAEVNVLKKAILMPGKGRSSQRVESFINKLKQGTSSLTDEEFARLERMIREKRGRAAAHVVVTPIDTAQPCNPQSCSSEISFDVHVCIEENTEGVMDPEPGELKK